MVVKRIGVAVGNSFNRMAQALKTIQNPKTLMKRFRLFQKLVKEWEVNEFVVGLPTHPDGAEHENELVEPNVLVIN
jgi:putative Holliday junction resolvase